MKNFIASQKTTDAFKVEEQFTRPHIQHIFKLGFPFFFHYFILTVDLRLVRKNNDLEYATITEFWTSYPYTHFLKMDAFPIKRGD